MITVVVGTLIAKDLDRAEVLTASGLAYELAIPLGVFDSLPKVGEQTRLQTHLVVKEDGWQLFGFATVFERQVFRRVLEAKGVGPALALGMLSTLSAARLVRAICERDLATLQSVPRVGRKKAEQLLLDLAEKMGDLQRDPTAGAGVAEGAGADDAIRALVSLGYSPGDAERAVRTALDGGGQGRVTSELVRLALGKIGGR
ncbi:MAG: Holliday junction branch migration protein RuvA [Gemmatimonadaceae bacterium]